MEYQLKANHTIDMNSRDISVPCFAFCLLIVLIIGLLPLFSSKVTLLFRPVFIAACILFPRAFHYKLTKASKAIIIYIAYLGVIYSFHDITKSSTMNYFAMVLFGLMFILATQRIWTKREIRLFLYAVIIVSAFVAVVILIENEDVRRMNIEGDVDFFGHLRNRNSMGYSLVPGALCCILLLIHNPHLRGSLRSLPFLIVYLLCGYTIIATAARSASLSFLVGSFLIVWEQAHYSSSLHGRFGRQVIIIAVTAVVILLLVDLTSDTTSSRIFENLTDKSGREDLWEFAWDLIHKKPVFGGGFDYWDNMGGSPLYTHNTYLMIMVFSGYVGALFLTGFLGSVFFELLLSKNLIPLAFTVELFFHVYTETGLDYYAYIPLIYAYIIFQYIKNFGPKISRLFDTASVAGG